MLLGTDLRYGMRHLYMDKHARSARLRHMPPTNTTIAKPSLPSPPLVLQHLSTRDDHAQQPQSSRTRFRHRVALNKRRNPMSCHVMSSYRPQNPTQPTKLSPNPCHPTSSLPLSRQAHDATPPWRKVRPNHQRPRAKEKSTRSLSLARPALGSRLCKTPY